ncbi:helix-turn-helix domain-containing protein [Natrinema salifodinae]|uniref:Predicted DNA binding protein, contains HTH domain n=1 Tax=Natrinema salifodinae TaxID=1202768 RepID=A0A1I0N7B2_9EURY|nr:helix-turn-helix domain-containing protein [Natrinema salifodinae]SEV97059.1 Predicted DNA binding protein, contains HTH domain [Natrinema salifodinae]
MISAKLRIQLPEGLWVSQISRTFPRATFRLLSGYRVEDTALELGETITDQPKDVVTEIYDHPSIETYELLESDERRALVKYETTDTALYDFVETLSVTIEFPIIVRDGWYEFDLTGTREELDRLQELLDASPLSYELLSLVRSQEADNLLTDRQREVLETAVRAGYFEIPRECTLSELADSLEIDKSTASTILRRGEARLIKSFVSGPD